MAHALRKSSYVAVLTGAGISVESGIPDFRSPGGLWSRFDPMEYGHIASFRANPGKVWEMLVEMDELLSKARPNPAHYALAELENAGIVKGIVTQNVDSLHQHAGSREVVEFHGNNRTLRCDRCGRSVERDKISLTRLPPLCACGGPLRPDFVFFGENIPASTHDRALVHASRCDVMMIVGTSVSVAPASHLPYVAKARGASIIEINLLPSQLTDAMCDFRVLESAGSALPAIVAALREEAAG